MAQLQSLVCYFENNISKHNRVERCERRLSANEDEYIYEIHRKDNLPPVRVYISDAYEYGAGDYTARPGVLKAGDFILVDSFGPGADTTVVEQARHDCIGVGPFRKLFGALNSHDIWKYRMPAEKAK